MRIIMVFIGVVIATILYSETLSAKEQPKISAPTVVVEKAVPASAKAFRRYVGMAEAINSVQIMPRINGELRKIHFTGGSGKVPYRSEIFFLRKWAH